MSGLEKVAVNDPKIRDGILALAKDGSEEIQIVALTTLKERKDKSALPGVQTILNSNASLRVKDTAKETADALK